MNSGKNRVLPGDNLDPVGDDGHREERRWGGMTGASERQSGKAEHECAVE